MLRKGKPNAADARTLKDLHGCLSSVYQTRQQKLSQVLNRLDEADKPLRDVQ